MGTGERLYEGREIKRRVWSSNRTVWDHTREPVTPKEE